jgi:hypothetical protein
MTSGGNTPYGPGAELPTPSQPIPGGFPPPGGQSGPWPTPPAAPPAPQRRSGLVTAGIATSLAIGTAALVVAGISLTRQPAASTNNGPSTSATATDTSAADKALCEEVAPILAEGDRISNAYTDLGNAGSPARDAATPKFVNDTDEWVQRAQATLEVHTDASGFLQRSLQRFLDESTLLAVGLRPGPLPKYVETTWENMMSSYNGPITTCRKLGVKW